MSSSEGRPVPPPNRLVLDQSENQSFRVGLICVETQRRFLELGELGSLRSRRGYFVALQKGLRYLLAVVSRPMVIALHYFVDYFC